MSTAPALFGYAAAVGVLAPVPLLRARWPHRAPALALAVWQALTLSFLVSLALAVYDVVVPAGHLHTEIVGLLHSCGVGDPAAVPAASVAARLAMAAPGAVVGTVALAVAVEVLRGRRARSRHRALLDIVGRRSRRLGATVLDHDRPAAYCLPGRGPRVVVSAGALRLLSDDQLDAVLLHERAHITGRHHLVLAAAGGFARVFRWLPLAWHGQEQTAVLLEMIADDRALRRQPGDVLAAAMYGMATATAPAGAFAVGGPTALLRLRRVLAPRHRPPLVLRTGLAAAAAAVVLLPLAMGCLHGVG
ncbi:M56 family metallopeptidase [Streptomyces uncialis]|uniref:M56 family metallopeptidase n=1 Tax=Streptomyces uncialis TaxID=1048205 RepID=UPI00386EA757|nr:M56 family metallopeptidase [Streptomyces uncialis]